MYKEIKIVYTESAKEDIMAILEKLNIEKYMNLEKLQAMWAKDVRHLDNRIWPGTDSLMLVILEDELAKQLLTELRNMKKNLMEGVDLFVLVTAVEEII